MSSSHKGKESTVLSFPNASIRAPPKPKWIRRKRRARALDVNSTPTLFVNGRRMVGTVQWPDLKRVIDYEIDYQKTAKNAGEDCGCSVQLPMPGVARHQRHRRPEEIAGLKK